MFTLVHDDNAQGDKSMEMQDMEDTSQKSPEPSHRSPFANNAQKIESRRFSYGIDS